MTPPRPLLQRNLGELGEGVGCSWGLGWMCGMCCLTAGRWRWLLVVRGSGGSRPSTGGWLRHAARAGKENGCEWSCWPRGQVPSKDKQRGGSLIGEATGAGRERAFPSSPGGIWKEL